VEQKVTIILEQGETSFNLDSELDAILNDFAYGNARSVASKEDVLRVLGAYAILGNMRLVAEHLSAEPHLNFQTIRKWMQADWWKSALTLIRKQKQGHLDAKLTQIMDLCTNEMVDRLIHGEAVLDKGEIKRKPVSLRDATITAAVTYDKRALLRGDPTSRSERINPEEAMTKLAEQFVKMAQSKGVNLVPELKKEERTIN
jgi:hypothetical protein